MHQASPRLAAMAAMAAMLAILVAVLFGAGTAVAQEPVEAGCSIDADCKLIYSSCSCVAVPVSDPRVFLPANVDCAVNRCRAEHVRPSCVSHVCEPASKDPPRAPGSAADADGRPDTNQ
ncbi:MAG TPA: hypothetical protein PKC03_05365 [Dokdonella sp.]|nr:hypothetical protein [Dokdonella sp.]